MGKSPFQDAIISLVVAVGVLFGASWVLQTINEDVNDPVGGMEEVLCNLLVETVSWHPSFPCWWVFAGALLVIWLLLFGAARTR